MFSLYKRNVILALLLLGIALIVAGCQFPAFLSDIKVSTMSTSDGSYVIEPDSILQSLANGENNVFIPQTTTPQVKNSNKGIVVQWTQFEYFKIAQAFHRFVWNEPIENWKISGLFFKLDCKDVSNGPQFAHFELFKITNTRENETRFIRDLWIEPQNNSVSWQDTEYYPNVQGKTTIDLDKLEISSDEALRIAENNGGYDIRVASVNECLIYITLSPESSWDVRYSDKDLKNLFNLKIDTISGEISEIRKQ